MSDLDELNFKEGEFWDRGEFHVPYGSKFASSDVILLILLIIERVFLKLIRAFLETA